MATTMVPKTTCDVYPDARKVKRYRVTMEAVPADAEPGCIFDANAETGAYKCMWVLDLSEKARARAEHFIEVGITPPRPKKASENSTGSEG